MGQTEGATRENTADALTPLHVLGSPWFKTHVKVDAVGIFSFLFCVQHLCDI
jgi:hypothetical protein